MLSIEEVKSRLKDMNLRAVSYNSGVSYATVLKISKGGENCKYSSFKKVSDYLESRE